MSLISMGKFYNQLLSPRSLAVFQTLACWLFCYIFLEKFTPLILVIGVQMVESILTSALRSNSDYVLNRPYIFIINGLKGLARENNL